MFYAVSLVMNSILWRKNPQWEQSPKFYLSLNSPSWAQNSIQFCSPWIMSCPVWRPIFGIQLSLLGNGCEKMLHPGTIQEKQGWDKLKLGSFSAHIFEMQTGNRSEQFSLTTFLQHTTTLTLLSSFSLLGMISIKTLGDTTVLVCKNLLFYLLSACQKLMCLSSLLTRKRILRQQ